MIERAAACLKNGGKHVLRTPKWNLRTHRSLHSAFWSHGAGDIDLPAWWLALLQVPSTCDLKWSPRENATSTSRSPQDGLDLGLLDFLYPKKTLAFIRKCVRGNSATVRLRHRPSPLLLQRSRAYTSAADGSGSVPLDQDKKEQECTDVIGETKVANDGLVIPNESECKAKLHELLYAKEPASDAPTLWQAYRQLMRTSLRLDTGDLIRLFERLSTSMESLEIEITIDLFNVIPESRRRPSHYKYAINAALKQQQLESAMDMHREALSRIQGDFGSSIIFEYAIRKRIWDRAEEIWKVYWDHRQLYCTAPALLWEHVDTKTVSWQMERATSAVKNAVQRIETTGRDDARLMCSLAVWLVQRALNARKTGFKGTLQLRMLNLMKHIQEPDLTLYKAAVLQNLSLGVQSHEHSEMAVKLYRQIRGELNIIPDRDLLKAMTKRFSALRDSQGMYEVLEDFQRYHEGPPPSLYSVLMAQLARHGDLDTIEALFQQYVAEYGKADIQNHANLLLWACFRRAEADRAERVLQSLQEKYGYIPDLKAWNIVLGTYVRVRDCDGAMALFEKLVGSDIPPDNSSYGILMGMFAKNSDFEAAGGLFERATSAGIKPNRAMVENLIVGLVNSDRFDEAYQMVEKAQTMDLDEKRTRSGPLSLTRMWNTLLTHCALKGQLDKVTQIQQRMHASGVPFDSHTYSALMLSLCIKKLPGAALRIMEAVMPRSGARVTAWHYSIVMGGFMQTNEPEKVLHLANQMLEKGISPTFSTQEQLLRTASKVDEQENRQDESLEERPEERPFHARRAEQVLAQALEALNPMELAPSGPRPRAGSSPPNVAFYASYFPYLISLYGKKQSFERVVDMYDTYVATAQKVHGVAEVDPPVELLSALMVAHTNAGEHSATEKCWHLAMEKSGKIACKMNADTAQPGWVLHKHRFLLAVPLTRYMQSLHATGRVDDIATTVDYLQHAGYQLSVNNWNEYVQILAKESRSMAAFETCEQHLMDDWPGWARLLRRHGRVKTGFRKQLRPPSWEMGKQVPHYETLVYLAGVFLYLRRLPYGTGKGPVQELQKTAPRALEAVLKMPRIKDEVQPVVLQGRR
ncbi:MAG: hypothetical protein Q9182_000546 [Xanthomendoza sp. 2 TL-2023]